MVLVLVIVIALILYILIFPIKNAFKIKKQEEEIIRLKSKLSDLEFKFQGNSNVSSETEYFPTYSPLYISPFSCTLFIISLTLLMCLS